VSCQDENYFEGLPDFGRSPRSNKSVGPFPQEPAPGSPEAVAQAAETIRRWADPEGVERGQTVLRPHPLGEWLGWKDHCRAVEDIEQQRDALADALEALLKGRGGYEVVSFIPVIWIPGEPGSARQEVANTVSAEQSRAALRAAGRL
jgi:hypothetical protein